MIDKFKRNRMIIKFPLFLLLKTIENIQKAVIYSDFQLIILRYSFLLTETPADNIFFKRFFSSLGEPSTQNSNGARYLDPKYSRWISTDPALGEYVPQAPVSDEAKKNNQNLPGMGGLFNTVNLSLYHYAGNNPVRFTDPNGESVFVDGDEDATLKALNKYSYYQYKVDDEGYLYKTGKINKKGSTLYSEAIDRCIADENSEIIIRFVDKDEEANAFGEPIDVKGQYGGGVTIYNDNEPDPSEIYVFFMKNGRSADGKWKAPAAQVLMHEIVGHADPIAAGGERDNELSIWWEDLCLAQMKRYKQMRPISLWHTAR